MKTLKQTMALLRMNLSGIPQRLGASAVSVIGIACVVGVLVAMLSMGEGVRTFSKNHIRADRALVFSKGASDGNASNLDRATVLAIADLPGIKHDADGKALAAVETLAFSDGRRKSDNNRINMQLRGVNDKYLSVYPEIKITAGRMFRPGLREVVVGKSQHEQIKGLELGDNIRFRGSNWLVVGHYDADRALNLNIIADADTLMSASGRQFSQLTVLLNSPAAFNTLKAAIKENPSLNVELKHEAEVINEASKQITTPLNFVSYFIGAIMAMGATLGAVNAMYAVVDQRRREIATLRAIGFRSFPIVMSVLCETLLLALPGALLGIVIAWLFFNGNTINPVGISIKLAVTPTLVSIGVIWALLMGLIGGLFPAIRAARMPVATALRAV